MNTEQSNRGGRRNGSGRPPLAEGEGVVRTTITLTVEAKRILDTKINRSKYINNLILSDNGRS